MSGSSTAQLEAIFKESRQLFHALRAISDELHAGSGITAAMRGVLESLAGQGPLTVPQMARARPVSRQHVQTIVDALAERDLVELVANPGHKRSSLVRLTDAGSTTFAALRATERRLLDKADPGVSSAELELAARVLGTLNCFFRGAEWALVLAAARSTEGGAG